MARIEIDKEWVKRVPYDDYSREADENRRLQKEREKLERENEELREEIKRLNNLTISKQLFGNTEKLLERILKLLAFFILVRARSKNQKDEATLESMRKMIQTDIWF